MSKKIVIWERINSCSHHLNNICFHAPPMKSGGWHYTSFVHLFVCYCICVCVCPILGQSKTSTFITGFQTKFAHLFSLTSNHVKPRVCFDMPKVKVTVEGQMFILVWSITSTFINVFQNSFARLFSLTSTSIMQNVCLDLPKVKVTVGGQMFELTLSGA